MRGVSRDLPVVKMKTSEGLVARLLMVGIVRIVPRNKLIDQCLFYKIASAREGSRVGPPARPNACHRPFLFSKVFSNLVSKVHL